MPGSVDKRLTAKEGGKCAEGRPGTERDTECDGPAELPADHFIRNDESQTCGSTRR